MFWFKTLVQILIAASVASSAVAAPVMPTPEVHGDAPGRSPSPPLSDTATVVDQQPTRVPEGNTHTYPPTTSMSAFAALESKYPGWKVPAAAAVVGSVGSGAFVGGMMAKASHHKAQNYTNPPNSTAQRSVEDRGHISRSLANLRDEHLLFLRDISRWARALEGLD